MMVTYNRKEEEDTSYQAKMKIGIYGIVMTAWSNRHLEMNLANNANNMYPTPHHIYKQLLTNRRLDGATISVPVWENNKEN